MPAPREERFWIGNCIYPRSGRKTKPQLARVMLQRALESGVPAAWVTADEVNGSDRRRRVWLEQQGVSHLLAVKRREMSFLHTL